MADKTYTPLEITQQIINAASAFKNKSLAEYTAPTRLEPTLLIDNRVLAIDQKKIIALEQTLLSLYCAYYLSAINMSMNVGNVNVMRMLDQFSTDRSVLQAAQGSVLWDHIGNESYDSDTNDFISTYTTSCMIVHSLGLESVDDRYTGLSNYGINRNSVNSSNNVLSYALEASIGATSGNKPPAPKPVTKEQQKILDEHEKAQNDPKYKEYIEKRGELEVLKTKKELDELKYISNNLTHNDKPYDNDKSITTIKDESNLVVGKVLDVKIVNGDQFTSIPVMCRLTPMSIDPQEFLDISNNVGTDGSARARWRALRMGEIRFFKDYLFCLDRIEADKKALLADKTGSLLVDRNRKTTGLLAAVISGRPSPNAISTMIVISKSTATSLEQILHGRLNDFSTRQRWFKGIAAMMLVVVDINMERFTIYQRGIATAGNIYTFDDISSNGKKPNGVNIEDVMKAYNLGHAATF